MLLSLLTLSLSLSPVIIPIPSVVGWLDALLPNDTVTSTPSRSETERHTSYRFSAGPLKGNISFDLEFTVKTIYETAG